MRKLYPEVKALWIEALRSGEYNQGIGALRNRDDRYCCMGVLCELAVEAGVIPAPTLGESEDIYAYEGCGALPSPAVRNWAGLPNATGCLGLERLDLVEMNDTGSTFAEIADAIEGHF